MKTRRAVFLSALALLLSALMGTTLLAGRSAAPAAHPAAVTFDLAGHFGGWLAAISVPAPSDLTGLRDLSGLNHRSERSTQSQWRQKT